MYSDLALYIDGKWMNGGGRKGEDVINPATEKPLAHLPHASKADLDEALEAAKKGFALWRATSAYDRAKIMRKAADLMRERHDAIAKIMVQEQGKVYAEARVEVMTSADIIDWYAEEGRRSYGRIVPGRVKGTRQLVVQEPVGVVAAFTPWNFPVLTPARKVGGALAAGCSLILKASEETPGACVEMVRCFADAGAAGGRAQPGVRRAVGGLRASAGEGRGAQDFVHRLDPGRQASRRARGQGHEAHHHGARRPFAGRGVRRRRSGEGRRHHRGVQVSQCRPGLHLADALLRAGGRLQEVPRALHRIRQGHQARRRAGEGHHHGADGQCAPHRRHGQLRRRRQAARRQGRDRRQAARQPGLFLRADGRSPTCRTIPRS